VLIDCPPSLGLLTVNAMVATEELLIPIQCEYYALEGLGQLLKNVELVRNHLNPALHVSTILLTMYDARTKLADQVREEVRNHFGDTVLATTIPRSVRCRRRLGTVSPCDLRPGSRGRWPTSTPRARSPTRAPAAPAPRDAPRDPAPHRRLAAPSAPSSHAGRVPTAAATPPPHPSAARQAGAGAPVRRGAVRPHHANPLQPRTHFDEEALGRVVVSIAGRAAPAVVVRPSDGDEQGEALRGCPWASAWRAGPARPGHGGHRSRRSSASTATTTCLRDALLENLHRQQLNPLEEAAAYQQLLHEFGATHEELAAASAAPPADQQHHPAAQPAPAGAAPGRRRRALGRPRARDPRPAHPRGAGGDGRPRRRRGAVGARRRGGRAPRQRNGADDPARPARAASARAAGLVEVADRLLGPLRDPRARSTSAAREGKVTIEFASVDDLERIVAIMESRADGAQPQHGGDAQDH
jgi:hypothetical protein